MGTPFTVRIPAQSIGDQEFGTSDPLGAEKQEHQHTQRYAQAHGTAAVAHRQVLHAARSAGQLLEFRAGVSVACVGDSTITVNLYKNGSTILSAPVVIDSGDAAYDLLDAAFASSSFVADDVFEVVVTVSAGTGTLGQGLVAQLMAREAA